MKVFKILSILFFVSVINLIAQTEDWSKLKSQFQDMDKKFAQAMMNNDQQSINAMYTEDAVSMPSYSPILKGKNAIADAGKKDIENGTKYNDFQVTLTDLFGDGKYAYEIGKYKVDFTMKKMGDMKDVPAARSNETQNMKDEGKYLNVWEKQADGSWKIKAEIWNSDVNPFQSMQGESKREKDDSSNQEKY